MGIFLSRGKRSIRESVGPGIYDVIDTADPSFMTAEVAWIKDMGGDPILMADGETVQLAIMRLMERSFKQPIQLLRIHGHGFPGCQGVTMGTKFGNYPPFSVISTDNLKSIQNDLGRLSCYFSRGADVCLMGCNAAEGELGKQLIQSLANLWRVPVTGAVEIQYVCDKGQPKFDQNTCKAITMNYEGPIETAYPK